MKKKYSVAGISAILFLLLIIVVKTVDVQNAGALGSSIGLAGINCGFHNLTGMNLFWYDLTEILGVVALLVAALFAVLGCVQLVKKKSVLKVDNEILLLGVIYVVTICLYVLFEKVIINYRPVLMEGSEELEASFPSSHTMLICVIMGTTMIVLNKYIKNANACKILRIVCAVIAVLMVVGRLVCGVHWLTDILGGVLISATLVFAFWGTLEFVKSKKN